MVAVVADRLAEPFDDGQFVAEQLAEIVPFPRIPKGAPALAPTRPRIAYGGDDDPRTATRKDVALKCWLMDDEGSARGYALDISKDGARLSGVGSRFTVGQRLLCKLLLDAKQPALVVRCKIVRVSSGEVGVRFLELGFDEWFRLGRFLDRL